MMKIDSNHTLNKNINASIHVKTILQINICYIVGIFLNVKFSVFSSQFCCQKIY